MDARGVVVRMLAAVQRTALAAAVNRIPVPERAIRVGDDCLYADSVDRYLAVLGWKLGWLGGEERRLVERVVFAGAVTVDVGANIGFHTLWLARHVGSSGRVYAIEPDPRNFRLLERAVAAARLPRVRLYEAAAADRSGTLSLFLSPINRGDHRVFAASERRRSLEVRATTLDEILAPEPHVDFIKVDVQGAEVAVLRGARQTLRRNAQIGVLCEVCPLLLHLAGAAREDLFEPLSSAGLHAHRIEADGTLHRLDEREAWAVAEEAFFTNLYFQRP